MIGKITPIIIEQENQENGRSIWLIIHDGKQY